MLPWASRASRGAEKGRADDDPADLPPQGFDLPPQGLDLRGVLLLRLLVLRGQRPQGFRQLLF